MVAATPVPGFKSGYFHLTLGTPLAVIATIAVAVAVGMLTEFVVFRPLRRSSPLAKLIASLGILLTLQATVLLWFGTSARRGPEPPAERHRRALQRPSPGEPVLDGRHRGGHRGLGARGAVPVDALRVGHASRLRGRGRRHARRPLAQPALAGQHDDRVPAIAGVIGIISGPLAQADSTTLASFIAPALAAALFARFTSIAIACLSGLLIGIGPSVHVLRLDPLLVPEEQGRQPAPWRAGPLDLPDHRGRPVGARREPSDAWRAGREAAAGGTPSPAAGRAERCCRWWAWCS